MPVHCTPKMLQKWEMEDVTSFVTTLMPAGLLAVGIPDLPLLSTAGRPHLTRMLFSNYPSLPKWKIRAVIIGIFMSLSEPALLCWSHPIQMWLHLSLWLSREYFWKFVLPIYQPFHSPLLMGFGRLCYSHKSIWILLQAKLFPKSFFLFNNTCTIWIFRNRGYFLSFDLRLPCTWPMLNEWKKNTFQICKHSLRILLCFPPPSKFYSIFLVSGSYIF